MYLDILAEYSEKHQLNRSGVILVPTLHEACAS